jgi:hypothetical protein
MIDACMFNFLIDGNYTINDLPPGKYYITHIQRDELDATPDQVRRHYLRNQFNVINSEKVLTSVALSGLARSGEASCGDDQFFNIILSELDKLKKKKNNYKDAVIGATAIQNNFLLITGDTDFTKVIKSVWGKNNAIFWKK